MPAAITLRVCEEFISAPTRRDFASINIALPNVRKEAAARSISHAAQFDRVPAAKKSNHRHCRLLRARRERPSGRAAEQHDELAPLHSITSSAPGGGHRPEYARYFSGPTLRRTRRYSRITPISNHASRGSRQLAIEGMVRDDCAHKRVRQSRMEVLA